MSSICCHLFHGRIKKHGFTAMTFKIVTCHSDKSQWTDVKADRIHVAAEMYQHIHVEHKVVVFIEETHWTICRQNCGHSPKCDKAYTQTECFNILHSQHYLQSQHGHSYTIVAKGSITSDIFNPIINRLFKWFVKPVAMNRGCSTWTIHPIYRPA